METGTPYMLYKDPCSMFFYTKPKNNVWQLQSNSEVMVSAVLLSFMVYHGIWLFGRTQWFWSQPYDI